MCLKTNTAQQGRRGGGQKVWKQRFSDLLFFKRVLDNQPPVLFISTLKYTLEMMLSKNFSTSNAMCLTTNTAHQGRQGSGQKV